MIRIKRSNVEESFALERVEMALLLIAARGVSVKEALEAVDALLREAEEK